MFDGHDADTAFFSHGPLGWETGSERIGTAGDVIAQSFIELQINAAASGHRITSCRSSGMVKKSETGTFLQTTWEVYSIKRRR